MPSSGRTLIGGKPARVRKKTYRLSDFTFQGSGDTIDLSANNTFERVYILDIEDGVAEWFGRGNQENPLQAQGFVGARFVNDGAGSQAEGVMKVTVLSPTGRELATLFESDLNTVDLFDSSGNVLDRKNREPLPNAMGGQWETSNHELAIELDVDSAITVDDAETQTQARVEGYRAEAES